MHLQNSLKDGYELYTFGTLDTNNVTLLASLTPKTFKIKVYHTTSGMDLLQLYIATTDTMPDGTNLRIVEFIPSMYNCSWIISSKVVFGSVLAASLGDAGVGLTLKANPPKDLTSAFSATATGGTLSGPFTPTMVGNRSSKSFESSEFPPQHINYRHYVAVPNNKVDIKLTGMTFTNGNSKSGYSLEMGFTMYQKAYPFKYGTGTQVCGIACGEWSGIAYKDYTLKVTVSIGAPFEFTI